MDLSRVMERIVAAGPAGREVEDADRQDAEDFVSVLREHAIELDNTTTERANALIAQNESAYTSSRNLFIGAAAGAIGLALLLGFVLSWSVIGPIQRIGARLSATASGDFTGHVDVTNRDELGALAANVNRMNDELRRLYQELESASQHKSDFLAEHVARAADAAERDHRLLAGPPRGDGRRGEREAEGVPGGHPLLGQSPALAHQRRARPVQGRSRAGRARRRAVLAAGRARERRRHGARARDEGRRPGHARADRRRPRRPATSAASGRSSSTCSRTP